MNNIKKDKQDILIGSTKLSSLIEKKFDKNQYMIENMQENLAFKNYLVKNNIKDKNIVKEELEKFQNSFREYRKNWVNAAKNKNINKPLSLDLEIAAICDLACPHCHREYLVTPDKIMNEALYKKMVDEAADMGVPSIKLIWRGEPLLHPKLKEFIIYAKKSGILEVIINSNATNLDENKSRELIESGLDLLIYSFDGGTKDTYEKMRPGRFKKNSFENVYNNIKKFKSIREKLKSKFPVTKIQMIMTKETRDEVDDFYQLFKDYVDDVTVTQYNERGGKISDLSEQTKKIIFEYFKKNNLSQDTPYMVDLENNIFISKKRITCDQIYQRLMITYSGKVGMCCHDWGARHTIGYVDEEAYSEENEIKKVKEKIKKNKKGFELLKNAVVPKSLNQPDKKISFLKDIWQGKELKVVREKHENDEIDTVDICKNCTFKDTYSWEKIN